MTVVIVVNAILWAVVIGMIDGLLLWAIVADHRSRESFPLTHTLLGRTVDLADVDREGQRRRAAVHLKRVSNAVSSSTDTSGAP